jgi:hypothetical protein
VRVEASAWLTRCLHHRRAQAIYRAVPATIDPTSRSVLATSVAAVPLASPLPVAVAEAVNANTSKEPSGAR